LPEERLMCRLIGFQVQPRQQRIVVQHFFKMVSAFSIPFSA
jgi:hypothetical protein